jgi:DNA-binding NarL/FixJ family response regulator
VFLAAPVDDWFEFKTGSHVEGADSLRGVHLVAYHGEQINTQFADADRDFPYRLGGVAVKEHAAVVGDPRNEPLAAPREVEVLVLISRGATTARIASSLGISRKTAGTHVERIYTKTGASSRSTATLFALRNGLLDPLDL